jgi:glutathione reductase (NADPH)
LVVVGTGTAATTVAKKCRRAGWSVAVIDSRPFGGTCALRGCDPKKILVGAAEVIDAIRRFGDKGVAATNARIEWTDLMRFKHSIVDAVPERVEQGFAQAGIATFHGRARFIGSTAIAVGDSILESRRVVVAAGAKPASMDIEGADFLTTSERFLELDDLPRRIVFVGGGFISFEFAHVAARAGASATILHRGTRPLNRFDPDLAERLVARSRAIGIDVRVNTAVQKIARVAHGCIVHAIAHDSPVEIEADLVVHGAGRVPEIDDLDLDAAGIQWSLDGVKVNEHLQSTSNPAVYAAGDAAANGAPRLTPVAAYDGHIVAANLLDEGRPRTPDYSVVPSVVFATPPLATVGLLESIARDRGLNFEVRSGDTASWFSSRRVGETHSGYKVLIERSSERILGAHVLGPHAEEVINAFAIAMRAGLTSTDIKKMIFAYPTSGSDIASMV